MPMRPLLLEIGCEELPSSFVAKALEALPHLAQSSFAAARLNHTGIRALGTPRRLALLVEGLDESQPNLEEEVMGPPVRAAFKDGVPTKAAEAFAQKLGVAVDALERRDTPKGEYLVGVRKETGQPTAELLPKLFDQIVRGIPFRKSMRWGYGTETFGRPIQWMVTLFGKQPIPFAFAGVASGTNSRGHRFLSTGAIELGDPSAYVVALRNSHVLVDPAERATAMKTALVKAAATADASLIEDAFLDEENLSLVEEPHVVVGEFETAFLRLPERVILEVAKGHQRYFGLRGKDGKLLPKYLAVVNTAQNPSQIKVGNDRVMRARLADAAFFYDEDLKKPLHAQRERLGQVVFQKKLGTVLEKCVRIERLAKELGLLLQVPEAVIMTAVTGAHLCKSDLVSLMVGEFPELQGEMGRAYARAQGVDPAAADVIADHYLPTGMNSDVAPTDAAALVAIADRLDTLVGCFGIGLVPTGTADPYALRRAAIGTLRTLLARDLNLDLGQAIMAAYDGYKPSALELSRVDLTTKLLEFFAERLKGVLGDKLDADVVAAVLPVSARRPVDARARGQAISQLPSSVRASVGEVFKRAHNIAKEAPVGEPAPPRADAVPAETELYAAYGKLKTTLEQAVARSAYRDGFQAVAAFAPLMSRYFVDVFVMAEDIPLRESRLRLMGRLSETCSSLARLDLLGTPGA